ncbi:MAG: HAMP domain-containing sensor histidine kinase [Campylobacterota bacterium]|nr:HAMP domain-containing sensor histidine kinase [Campylobacterota bacterium]
MIDYTLLWQMIALFLLVLFIILFFLLKQNKLKNKIENLNHTLENKVKLAVIDIKNKEKEILHKNRLAQMGEMIGNISHQWRQPLAEINSIMMKMEIDFKNRKLDSDSLDKSIEKVEDLTEHMSTTIDSFNNFFKNDKKKTKFIISDSIRQVLRLFENNTKKYSIDINLEIIDDIEINSFQSEFIQVIIVIIQNAKDVLIANNIKNPTIKIVIEKIENNIIIRILDNGGGIPEEIIDKIFDPYFTTKFKSKGIGIGLYMAKIIIEKSMNGSLKVRNKENKAEFSITLLV